MRKSILILVLCFICNAGYANVAHQPVEQNRAMYLGYDCANINSDEEYRHCIPFICKGWNARNKFFCVRFNSQTEKCYGYEMCLCLLESTDYQQWPIFVEQLLNGERNTELEQKCENKIKEQIKRDREILANKSAISTKLTREEWNNIYGRIIAVVFIFGIFALFSRKRKKKS